MKDILNGDLGLIDSGLKDKDIECPIDYIEDKKGRVLGGATIALIVVVIVVAIIVCYCRYCKD